MRLLEFAHVDGDHVVLATEHQVRERERGFGFPDAGGAHQQEDAHGLARIVEIGARRADALADRFERMRLADHARIQVLLQFENEADFVLEHLADRDAGPGRNHLTDHLRIHADANQRLLALQLVELSVQPREVSAERSGLWRVELVLGAQLLHLPADVANGMDQVPLFLPAFLEHREPGLGLRLLRLDRREPLGMVGAHGGFTRQHARLHSQIIERTRGIFERGRRSVLPQREARARGVEHADGLVGQLAIRNIAMRQTHRGREPFIENAHLVVILQRLRHAA